MESYSNSSFINSENYHMNNSFLNYISYLDASINNNGIISNSPVNFLRSLSQTPQSRCNNIYSSYKVYTVENMSINKLLNILDNLRYEGHIFIPFEILNEIFLDKGNSCTVGISECLSTGVMICNKIGNGTICHATPKAPTQADHSLLSH